MEISTIARWPGKSPPFPGAAAHPAAYHMLDVAAVSERLLRDEPNAPLWAFMIAMHDLGKIGLPFRAMLCDGSKQPWRHWEMTEALLRHGPIEDLLLDRLDGDWRALRVLGAAIAGHHGRPPRANEDALQNMVQLAGPEAIEDARAFVAGCLDLWPDAKLDALRAKQARRLSWWLAGLTTVADWVGSNAAWFPPCAAHLSLEGYLDTARARVPAALEAAGLSPPQASGRTLFDFDLRPMQAASARIALRDGPMLAIIEDETGAGKTEAAFLLAQRMLLAGKGRGIYLALPTMATADAMFARGRRIVRNLFASPPSLTLAHGRAALSDDFREVQSAAPRSESPVCGPWLADDRRRALLADIGIGTIDQALLSVLPTKFATLRHWGLASKILIIDEVHELGNPYMAEQLLRLLRLHAIRGGSAILLSATLPLDLRARLSGAFEDGAGRAHRGDMASDYPSLCVVGGASERAFPEAISAKGPVRVQRLPDQDSAIALIEDKARAGCACVWVRNAVDDAISAVETLRARGVAADLLHARFALMDRKRIEAGVLGHFGRDGAGRAGRVLVGTQVLESSLDLDFDVMVSDLAPMASLIQRAGRLWRHMDLRPRGSRPIDDPVLHVISPDPAHVRSDRWLRETLDRGAFVYPLAEQWRTAHELFSKGVIDAPSGLRALIESVHGAGALDVPEALEQADRDAEGERLASASHARQNAIKIEDGYRDGGGAADDREYPTRLGAPTRTLLLARWSGETLFPAAVAARQVEAEMLSEVSAAVHRLAPLPLLDQAMPAIARLIEDWPEWKRASVTVCPLGGGGEICEGLRYDPELGLLF